MTFLAYPLPVFHIIVIRYCIWWKCINLYHSSHVHGGERSHTYNRSTCWLVILIIMLFNDREHDYKLQQLFNTFLSSVHCDNRIQAAGQSSYFRVRKHGCWGKYPHNKVHGANMGPTWVLSVPDGPHVGPLNFELSYQMYTWLWTCWSDNTILPVIREVIRRQMM